ncbi:dihydrolipoyllysine-residue acetyltransferase [Acidihalobacter yilgarnensis]|uniref:Acetyltransferase component of pyruvate dehydrogenase complex n=1 Tax=Acidihalobacter yilgarnensis TaxID=2819280 RepID=A0A1D8IL95_9GAMM|nr:dihydrolipoyllysine-residue acetyltransferase [Acidihalobacter yilgarnensis]AOU97252.1 dihydrolipoyllysine-residue acetyltransferase [Acidihalobacter yilgarnensis]
MAELKEIRVPDIGDFKTVEVIEVLVNPGDVISVDSSLITLESDKASMEIPAPEGGLVREVRVKVGDHVAQGSPILVLEPQAEAVPAATAPKAEASPPAAAVSKPSAPTSDAPPISSPPASVQGTTPKPSPTAHLNERRFRKAHASPAVRRFARELGVDLGEVSGSGPKGRVLREDVQGYVKRALSQGAATGGLGVAAMPEIDFSQFGEIEMQGLTKINRLTGQNLHRNWVTVPHVTQFDEADVTELESFRKQMVEEYAARGVKLTLLAFLMKAVVSALREFPRVNASLDPTQQQLILKKYFHIGIAVDTADGLVVPVIRDVDRKSLIDLARELGEISIKAREKKLKPSDMQGGCFSISSLGGLGGTAFTPIVNAPEVAILGVSRARWQPVYEDGEFVPRLMLPLSLSYDHRVIDGALGARFTTFLSKLLSDTRRMLL